MSYKELKVIDSTNVFNKSEQSQVNLMYSRINRQLKQLLIKKLGAKAADDYKLALGTSDGIPKLQNKVVTLGTSNQNISADTGYDGLGTVTVPAAIIPSTLTVKTAPTKVTYVAGETFDKTGLKCTATYSNGASRDIAAANLTVTATDPLTVEDTSVTISITEAGIEKTVTQAITVTAEAAE